MEPNSHAALVRRREVTLTWRGPALMLFARAAFAVGAQALVAAIFALRSSPTPWHNAEPWLPVYGTLIDAGCLALLWRLTRRERAASAAENLSAFAYHRRRVAGCQRPDTYSLRSPNSEPSRN